MNRLNDIPPRFFYDRLTGKIIASALICALGLAGCSGGTTTVPTPPTFTQSNADITPGTVRATDVGVGGSDDDGGGNYTQSYSNDSDLGMPAIPDSFGIAPPGSGGGDPPGPQPLVKHANFGGVGGGGVTVVYTSCTQFYQEKTQGIEDPEHDKPLGQPQCVSFTMGSSGPSFIPVPSVGGGNLGGLAGQYQPPCTTSQTVIVGGELITTSYGCSSTLHCRSDYYQDQQLAPSLLTAQLILAGVTAVTIGGIGAMLATDGLASPVAVWAVKTGGAGAVLSGITSLFTGMNAAQAVQIEAEASTLYADEMADGCATSTFS